MQIVIDMPDSTTKEMLENYESGSLFDEVLRSALKRAVMLPKEHGRIVDIDKLIDSKCNECGHIRGVSCVIPCYTVRRMLDADIIIEADKESEGICQS